MENSLIIVAAALLALAYVFVVRIYIAYLMAKGRHRDPVGWVLLSVFVSPLLTWIILLIAGDDKSALEREERLNRYEREDEWRRHDDKTRYLRSSYEDYTH